MFLVSEKHSWPTEKKEVPSIGIPRSPGLLAASLGCHEMTTVEVAATSGTTMNVVAEDFSSWGKAPEIFGDTKTKRKKDEK